jgi:hypothetical protein
MALNIINETRQILEQSIIEYDKNNEKYYNDVLKLLNMLFNDNAKSILKIKFKNITINDKIFEHYNNIIINYNINKDIIDISNFNINDFTDIMDFINMGMKISNNLLEKINYRIFMINNETNRIKIVRKK